MREKIEEKDRLIAITEYEREYWTQGYIVGGMDEVGRGPLAGPVVCACVILPHDDLIEGINDSKKLSEKRRVELDMRIRAKAIAVGIGSKEQSVIDEINILNATKRAFEEAFVNLSVKPSILLVDAVEGLKVEAKQIALIKGDEKSYLIGAASIVAKVWRDNFMVEMGKVYPEYGFENHKGYGSKQHIDALVKFGPCPLHRRSFIRNYV